MVLLFIWMCGSAWLFDVYLVCYRQVLCDCVWVFLVFGGLLLLGLRLVTCMIGFCWSDVGLCLVLFTLLYRGSGLLDLFCLVVNLCGFVCCL